MPTCRSILLSTLLVHSALPLAGRAEAEPVLLDPDHIGPRWIGPQYIDNLGWHVRSAGDLDGDGYSDIAVSSPQDIGPVTFDSILRIYMGRAGNPPESGSADWSDTEIADGKVGSDAVFRYEFIPDATGDGIGDLLVVEPNASTAGKVLLYPGTGADWPASLGAPNSVARWDGYLQDENPELAPETRPSLAGAGDFDGDGVADVAIASGLFNRVWVDYSDQPFAGTTSLIDIPDFFVECAASFPTAQFAAAMVVGDFDDDEFSDLAVAAPGCAEDEGRAYVWYGGATGLPPAPDLQIGNGDRLGGALHVIDLDGDGIDDLAIQERLTGAGGPTGEEGRGNLWVHFGSLNGLEPIPDVRFLGGVSDKRFGETVAVLSDVSNPADGLSELVVGSPEAAFGGTGYGAVYVFAGQSDWSDDVNANDAWYRVDGSNLEGWFGASVATLPDFNGDGYPEIVVGEPNYSTEGGTENDFHRGRFFLFDGLPDRDEDDDGFSTLAGDCDDTDPDVSPVSTDECGDGLDNDCDHVVDDGCGDDDDAVDDDDDDASAPGDDDTGEVVDCDCESSVAPAGSPEGLIDPADLRSLLLLGLIGLLAATRRSRSC